MAAVMATYAIRLQSVLGPVVERARRWSQSSTAEDRTVPPATLLNDDESITVETTITTLPPYSPRSLVPVFESSDIDSEDDSSEESLVVVDSLSVLRPQVSGQAGSAESLTPTSSLPSISPPEGPLPTSNQPLGNLVSGGSSPVKSSALPEDDGQIILRQKLVEISKLNISERDRATLMHLLMSEKYNASRVSVDTVDLRSPPLSNQFLVTAEELDVPQVDNPYKLSPRDTIKTYYTGPNPASELPARELGCSHYRRGVKLQCSTCERWYTCRFCHDENEDHALVRRGTKNMLCMHCGRAQPVGQDCRYCGIRSARYYCDKVCILAIAFRGRKIHSSYIEYQICCSEPGADNISIHDSVNCGTTTREKLYIIAAIAESVESDKGSGKTFSIARLLIVLFSLILMNIVNRETRNVEYACQSP